MWFYLLYLLYLWLTDAAAAAAVCGLCDVLSDGGGLGARTTVLTHICVCVCNRVERGMNCFWLAWKWLILCLCVCCGGIIIVLNFDGTCQSFAP